jgi:hypothetical protein
MSINAMMTGARLAFVVRELEGKVEREVCAFNPKTNSIEKKMKSEPAGYMVYFPRGHALRFRTMAQLKHYQLDQEPAIVNLEGLHDPKSAAGKLLRAQNEQARRAAFVDLEEQVIALATAKSGKTLMPEQLEQKQEVAA